MDPGKPVRTGRGESGAVVEAFRSGKAGVSPSRWERRGQEVGE